MQAREVVLHGHRLSYREAGSGKEVVLLIHGIAGTSRQWDPVAELLSDRFKVVAPDLLGHGASAKPRGDYSLGAYAVMVRDLLIVLGHRRATVVGHSLGGGIAMQFAYHFPVFTERLVLVASGGLGREVHPLLRAATLPGAELVLPLLVNRRVLLGGSKLSRGIQFLGLGARADLGEMARSYASLADGEARDAFIQTLRSVIDAGGQRVNASDRLYLAAEIPTLVIWGRRDPLIPVAHGEAAARAIPNSRLDIFESAGHFPQLDDPIRFARAVGRFVDATVPAQFDFSEADLERMRERLRRGAAAARRAAKAKRTRRRGRLAAAAS